MITCSCCGASVADAVLCPLCGTLLPHAAPLEAEASGHGDEHRATGAASPPSPSPPSDPACDCEYAIADPDAVGRCGLCGGRLVQARPPPGDQSRGEAPAARSAADPGGDERATGRAGEASPSVITVRAPDGRSLRLGDGLLVGRGVPGRQVHAFLGLDECRGVSRCHLWVGRRADVLMLLDLGSLNGCWLHGQRLPALSVHEVPVAALPARLRLGRDVVLELLAEQDR